MVGVIATRLVELFGTGVFDDLGHYLGMRHENGVAGRGLDGGRSRTLSHPPLLVWRDHPIFAGDEVPARFVSPGRVVDLTA
jgi:hypothetical protein